MKTVIIGLDGATFDIIKPLVSAGRMPVLSRLMREGVSAPLRSTILPNSFPGWASCTTGTSEGMHGVFSPFIKNPSKYTVRPMSGRDIMTRPVWDILTEHGGRSIVLNVPTTYPPEPINGLMVTGMLTPGRGSAFTHPASLKTELLAEFPNYVIEPERIPDKHARAKEFRRAIEVRERALKFLMQRGAWDFLMVVFSVLDRAQHDYWADMDPKHPRHDPRLLAFKSPASRKSIARVKTFKEKVSRRFSPSVPEGNVLDRKVEYGSAFLDEIDWSRTRSFFAQDKGVWINLAGRESEGVVSEGEFESVIEGARSALLRLTSPEDGEPVFESVMRREEVFNGAWSSNLPDLVMVPRRDEYVYNERPSYGDVIVPADSTTGTHSRDGIFIAWGCDVKIGETLAKQPNLRDVGPTALASLGCPLTKDMDGRGLMEVFSDSAEPQRQGSSYKNEAVTSGASVQSVYNVGEEAEIRERLKALGYIE